MSPTSINVEGKTPAQLLAEARKLLKQRPKPLEVIADIEGRRIAAAWLIAEADWQRASAALDAQARLDAEKRMEGTHYSAIFPVVRAAERFRDEFTVPDNPFRTERERALIDAVDAYREAAGL